MTDPDRILSERLAVFADAHDDSDWLDVRRRAGRRRTAWVLVPLAAAVGLVAVGAAFGLHRDVVDFVRADPAPERVVVDFARQSARAVFFGHGPKVVPGETRRVATFNVHGKPQPFYVAPTEDGGFCWRLEGGRGGSCGRTRGADPTALGVGWLERPGDGPSELTGHVVDLDVTRLELRYEDGARTEIPIVWVSPPIDAGFFHFEVPEDRTKTGRRATVLIGLDADGDVIDRRPFRYSDPRWEQGPDGLPRIADRSRKRRLFDFRDETGKRWWLDVAPAPGDRLCFISNDRGGCSSPRFPSGMPLGVGGGEQTMAICCTVQPGTATVELIYQDGERTELKPRDGFVLYVIPSRHYERGRRLATIVELGTSGREVARRSATPNAPGRYPCDEADEIDLGHGQRVCP